MKYDKAKAIIWYPEVYTAEKIQEACETIIKSHAPDTEDLARATAMSEEANEPAAETYRLATCFSAVPNRRRNEAR
jgi:hypothetical protein